MQIWPVYLCDPTRRRDEECGGAISQGEAWHHPARRFTCRVLANLGLSPRLASRPQRVWRVGFCCFSASVQAMLVKPPRLPLRPGSRVLDPLIQVHSHGAVQVIRTRKI
jgi:hypothetical protein